MDHGTRSEERTVARFRGETTRLTSDGLPVLDRKTSIRPDVWTQEGRKEIYWAK